MSAAANPRKKSTEETAAETAARKLREDRKRILHLLITLGDDPDKKVLGQIRGAAAALEDDVELHGDLIRTTVLDCARSLSLKSNIYAAWTGRLWMKKPDFVNDMVGKALEDFRVAIRSGQHHTSQTMLRFLVYLANVGVVSLAAVGNLLKEVLALSEGLRPTKGGDLGVFLVLSALLHLHPGAHEQLAATVEGLLAGALSYIEGRDARWKPLLRVLRSEDVPDRLESLVASVKSMKDANWSSKVVFHVPGFVMSLQGKENAPVLTPLAITSEEIRKLKIRFPVPMSALRLLTSKLEQAEGATPEAAMKVEERWILEDYFLSTVEMFGRDPGECAKHLLKIPFMHDHFEAAVVEFAFAQLLRLPSPPLLPLFYSRLLHFFMEKQETTKKLVEEAYLTLVEQAADLDEECVETLSDALAYHVLNLDYKVDWAKLAADAAPLPVQRLLRRTLDRLQRLSFHQNLMHRIPASVHLLVPPEPVHGVAEIEQCDSKKEMELMLKLVKIKEPDELIVTRFCRRLQGFAAKEEQGDDGPKPEAEGEAAPVGTESAAKEDAYGGGGAAGAASAAGDKEASAAAADKDAGGGGDDEEADYEEDPAKGKKDDDAEMKPPQGPKRAGSDEATNAKRKKLEKVKEEMKKEEGEEEESEDEDGVKKAEVTMSKHEEDETFGAAPEEPWTRARVVELFALALMQNGSKTPTHMHKILDGYERVFAKLTPVGEEEAHAFHKAVVETVFKYWRASGQRLEITLDNMMARGIVSPKAVVEQTLSERPPGSTDWIWMPVWNVTNSVARKALERTQAVRLELAVAKKLNKEDVMEKCRKQLDAAIHETAEIFTLIFTSLVRNHQDYEGQDPLRQFTVQRILVIGRKYGPFIKPLIDAAESRIPGVAHNSEIAAVFQSLRAL